MVSKSFDQRLDRIHWTPGATPTIEIIDSILGARDLSNARSAWATLAGVIVGIIIGLGVKGMSLPASPWGPDTGSIGVLGGTVFLCSLALSLVTAIYAAFRMRSVPKLMQFSSMNLLLIVVLQLS